jgi:hypothetical protein
VGESPVTGQGPVQPGDPHHSRAWGTRLIAVGVTGFTTIGGTSWIIWSQQAHREPVPSPLLDAALGAATMLAAGIGMVCVALGLIMIVSIVGVRGRSFPRVTYLMRLLPRVVFFFPLVRSGRNPDEVLPLGDVPPWDPKPDSGGAEAEGSGK